MARIIKCLPCRKGCMGYASFTFRDPPGAMTASNRATSQNRMMRAPALFVAGLLLLLALILGIQLYRQYRDDIAAGQATASVLTAPIDEHAGRSIASVALFIAAFSEIIDRQSHRLNTS